MNFLNTDRRKRLDENSGYTRHIYDTTKILHESGNNKDLQTIGDTQVQFLESVALKRRLWESNLIRCGC